MVSVPEGTTTVKVPAGTNIQQEMVQPSGATYSQTLPADRLQPPPLPAPLPTPRPLVQAPDPANLPRQNQIGASTLPAAEAAGAKDPSLMDRLMNWVRGGAKAQAGHVVDLGSFNSRDQKVQVYDPVLDVDLMGLQPGSPEYEATRGLATVYRDRFLREARSGLPVNAEILDQELYRHLIDQTKDDSLFDKGADGAAAATRRMMQDLIDQRETLDKVKDKAAIAALDEALAPLQEFYDAYSKVPESATRAGLDKMVARALRKSARKLINSGQDYLILTDYYKGVDGRMIRHMRVPIDPVSNTVLESVMHQAASAILDGRQSPSFAKLQMVLDHVAQKGGLQDLFMKENEEGKAGELTTPESPSSMRSSHSADQLDIYKFLQDDMTNRDAWNFLLEQALTKFDHPDTVWAGIFNMYANRWHRLEAAFSLGSKVGKHFTERAQEGFGKKRWEALTEGEQHVILGAIESRNPKTMQKAIDQFPELANAMSGYFAVTSALEHFKIMSPELRSSFTEHYITHRYPRMLEFVGSGVDIAHVSGIPGQKLYTEMERTIQNIPLAQRLAKDAERELKAKGFKNWRDYVYGPKGQDGVWDIEARSRALFGDTNPENLKTAQDLLKNVLLGDAITDPGTLLREQIIAAFRADASRAEIHQLRSLQTPDGHPLLVHRSHPGIPQEWVANVRMTQRGNLERGEGGKYKSLESVPGFARMQIEGKPTSEWLVHPMVAEFLKSQYLYKTPDKGGKAALKAIGDGVRGISLMGSWLPHLFSVQTAAFQSAGWSGSRASGWLTLGEHLRNKRSTMVMEAVRSGLQPQTFLRMIKEVSDGVARDGQQWKVLQDIFGIGKPIEEGANAVTAAMRNGIVKPLEWIQGLDVWLNRYNLFGAITDTMIGGWLHHTERVWTQYGPELVAQTGGNVGAAYALAKKHAATIMNDVGGSVPNYAFSDTARQAAYATALTPQLLMARVGYIAGTLDNLTSQLGKRGKYGTVLSSTLREDLRKTNFKFVAGSLVASMVFMDLMSRIANNGTSWVHNDTGKPNHVLVDIDEETGVRTYMNNPLFGMTRPITNFLLRSIKDRDPGGAALNFLTGQAHPVLNLAARTIGRGGATYKTGVPVTGLSLGLHTVGDYAEWLGYSLLPTEDMVGLSDMPYVGAPVSPTERALSLAGVSLSRIHPMRVLANQFDAEVRPVREKDFKYKMQPLIDSWVETTKVYGEDSEQAEAALARIEYAALEGVPFDDPSSEAAQAYAELHVDPETLEPDGQARYFVHDPESLRDMLLQAKAPAMLALNGAPKLFRMRLLRLAFQNADPHDLKGYRKIPGMAEALEESTESVEEAARQAAIRRGEL